MRDTHARIAGEAGVLVPVTTDAHSTGALGYAELGIAQARRAWLTKEQVLQHPSLAGDRALGRGGGRRQSPAGLGRGDPLVPPGVSAGVRVPPS